MSFKTMTMVKAYKTKIAIETRFFSTFVFLMFGHTCFSFIPFEASATCKPYNETYFILPIMG